jgi:hypothetical protein
LQECLGSTLRDNGVLAPRAWNNPPASFDTFPKSVLSLCRAFTLQWLPLWYNAQDAMAPGVQPVENHNGAMASAFFISFIFTGSFFAINLFTSFICNGFYAAEGVDSLDEIQYLLVKKLVQEHWPRRMRRPPKNIMSTMCR